MSSKFVLEYIWIGGSGELRSKIRVVDNIISVPEWNFDGSSTNQADGTKNTEVLLYPIKLFPNPLKPVNYYLVLCETYNSDRTPHITNTRYNAKKIFDTLPNNHPWFGLEQEYFIINLNNDICKSSGKYYCGTSLGNKQRNLVEEHLDACIKAGLQISGINAEVSPNQWEFQIGPAEGINAGDDMYIARFLLDRIAEKYDAKISYDPKINPDINGSGCHCNFSTIQMRTNGGINEIYKCIEKLSNSHDKHILVYGKDNEKRLTGFHETSSFKSFTYGIGTRNTSVRIPNSTVENGYGYFEDRRPAANIDPYLVSSIIYQTCYL